MITGKITSTILHIMLGAGLVSSMWFAGCTAYAADMSDIDVSSTKDEVQQVVDEGNFDYTKLDSEEINHVYELYNNDPETLKQLQKQSDFVSTEAASSVSSYSDYSTYSTYSATLASASDDYTHSSMFDECDIEEGIDVSEWNGTINWKKVKASGIDFAIIRAGGRYWGSGKYFVDANFTTNIKGALDAGLDVGVYFFSQAISTAEAKTEANYTIDLVSGYNINLPIVMDYEYGSGSNGAEGRLYDAHLSKSNATKVVTAFCNAVEAKGYTGMIYANLSTLNNDMNAKTLAASFPVWLAQYNSTDELTTKHSYWQYTSSGSVSGINARTDMNFRYIDNPAAVASVSQSGSSDSTITLTWSKVPEVYGYQIVRYDSSAEKYVSIGTVKGAGTLTFTDKELQDGKKYTYKVRGYYKLASGNVYGTYSDEFTGITIPDNVENFNATTVSANSIKLTWTPIETVTGYRILRYDSASKSYKTLVTLEGASLSSYTDDTVYAGTKYHYKIRAYSIFDTNTIWHVLSEKKSATTSVGQVSGVRVNASTSKSLSLKWNSQIGVSGYVVYTWDKTDESWEKLTKITKSSTTTYTHTGLKKGTEYTYSVVAYYKKNGKTKYTALSEPASGCTGPKAPENISAEGQTTKSIDITWDEVRGVSGYRVYLYNSSSKKYTKLADLEGVDNCSYTITGLSSTTTYKVAVRAYITRNGVTGFSENGTVSVCTKPRAISSSFKYTKLGSQVCLKWGKMSGTSGYVIYKYNKATGKLTRVKRLNNVSTTYCILPKLSSREVYRIAAFTNCDDTKVIGEVSENPVKAAKLTGKITGHQVRVRSGAGTGRRILTELSKGASVQITGYKKNSSKDTWYKIKCTKNRKTITGYVSSKYVKIK